MAGDNLTIVLFFVGLAATFFVAGMSQAGWKHWSLIGALFLFSAIFAGLGAMWLWIQDWSPVLRTYTTQIAKNPVSWFCLLLFGLSAVLWISRSKASNAGPLISNSRPNSISNALNIEFQQDNRFMRTQTIPAGGSIRRMVYVSVQNNGDGFLSDCKLVIRDLLPSIVSSQIPAALDFNFILHQGGYKFVPVAWYDERPAPTANADELRVVIAIPHTGGFFNGWTTIPANPRSSGTVFALEATALECGACVKHFRIWVADNKKLYLEEA